MLAPRVRAQEGSGETIEPEINCQDRYYLTGTEKGLINQLYTYEITTSGAAISGEMVSFFLGGKSLTASGNRVQHQFTQTGTALLEAKIQSTVCEITLEKSITLYEKNILYLGEDSDFLQF